MNHPTLADAIELVQRLEANGFEAYFVGGTVRDILLKREPHDIDIVTNAPPETTQALFPKHSPVGAKFGVVSVITKNGIIEVATYRTESGYKDRRRPSAVQWSTLQGDVSRRDFTINGLAYHPTTKEVIDLVDGQRDIALGLIRTIGNPAERFAEDPVRMLRAVRLKNQLGFQYEMNTYQAIETHADDLKHVSSERILAELERMFVDSNRALALKDLGALGLLKVILPEVSALHGVPQPKEYHQEGDVFDHTIAAVAALPKTVPTFLVWATMFHDIAKPEVLSYQPKNGALSIRTPNHALRSAEMSEQIMKRLSSNKSNREAIFWLIEHHMSLKNIELMRPAKRERYLLDARFPWLLELHRADALGTKPSDLSLFEHDLALYDAMKRHHQNISKTTKPLISGDDIIRAHLLQPSPLIQLILDEVRDAQLRNDISTKDEALSLARQLIRDHHKTS